MKMLLWRFLGRINTFLCIVVFTAIFWLTDKRKISLRLISKPVKSGIVGLVVCAYLMELLLGS